MDCGDLHQANVPDLSRKASLPPMVKLRNPDVPAGDPWTVGSGLADADADHASMCSAEVEGLRPSRDGLAKVSFLNEQAALGRCPAVLLHAWKKSHVNL